MGGREICEDFRSFPERLDDIFMDYAKQHEVKAWPNYPNDRKWYEKSMMMNIMCGVIESIESLRALCRLSSLLSKKAALRTSPIWVVLHVRIGWLFWASEQGEWVEIAQVTK